MMRHQESGHPRLVQSHAHPVTRHARLCYFEERATNPVAVTYAYLVIGQAVDRKIFAELPECKILTAEVRLPVAIGVRLVHHHGAMLSPVPGKISLAISLYIQPADHPPALNRLLPNRGANRLPFPCDVAGKTDVNRHKPSHRNPLIADARRSTIEQKCIGLKFVVYASKVSIEKLRVGHGIRLRQQASQLHQVASKTDFECFIAMDGNGNSNLAAGFGVDMRAAINALQRPSIRFQHSCEFLARERLHTTSSII